MTNQLPARPSLDHLRHQARNLQREHRAGDPSAIARVAASFPGHAGRLPLSRAQTVIAREYGVAGWPELRALVEDRLAELHRQEAARAGGLPTGALESALAAIRAVDRDALSELLRRHPTLARVQVNPDPGSSLLHEAVAVKPAPAGKTPADVIAIVDLLLAAGIDINTAVTLPGGTRLRATWFSLRGRSLEVTRHLLERGADPDGCLFAAAYGERADVMQLLHRHGANLEEMAHDETPLLHALKSRKLQSVRVLLALGADVNHADSKGATALHYAVRQYHDSEVIAVLLEHGAAPAALSKQGTSPLELARRMGRQDVVDQLVAAGADPDAPPSTSRKPQQTTGEEIRLRPFLGVPPESLEDAAAFYQELGFVLDSLDLDHSFASLTFGEARLLMSEGDSREPIASDAVVYLCPEATLAGLQRVARDRDIPHTIDATGALTVEDAAGMAVIFAAAAPGALAVTAQPRLKVADLATARAFYQRLGFRPIDDAPPSTSGLTLELGGSRVQIVESPSPPVEGRALQLWLVCQDFDAAYQRIRAELPIPPPQVAFHGDILFGVTDPDGHRVTFSAPATDI